MAQPPTFFTIPHELQKEILDLLPFPTLQVLHATHPHFRTLIDLDRLCTLTPREDLVDELVAAYRYDAFHRFKHMPPCRECLRFRPRNKFTDKVLHTKKPENWFCIDCGIDHIYPLGAEVWCQGRPGVLCKKCKVFKIGAENTLMQGGPLCRSCEEPKIHRKVA